ncbi:DUF494 family protein [Legionella bononiensis]|uniref:DUF494 family protein n=1 Tax=Legionella bononiensis TaxID=2793102 RepID=A0ABS1WA38_9GAMM|nr:DUF494 family protein [Legionella bononiensis]MBL7480547.1 DUF494 family protein [Legionella bononiensis]MBL7526214.1 DUF494 family protein [Legionella bononiensis]MBL7563291.1 DUF494 family protein [Legionella bononiensis]
MKDNLFEMLLNLFEKSLNQLQKSHKSNDQGIPELTEDDEIFDTEDQALFIKTAQEKSIRIFTYEEQMKLTKASYQFLMRMKLWGIIDVNLFELIINQLHSSESRIVTLQETKWTIRNVLENHMDEEHLAFLDLVLYQTEDELTLN